MPRSRIFFDASRQLLPKPQEVPAPITLTYHPLPVAARLPAACPLPIISGYVSEMHLLTLNKTMPNFDAAIEAWEQNLNEKVVLPSSGVPTVISLLWLTEKEKMFKDFVYSFYTYDTRASHAYDRPYSHLIFQEAPRYPRGIVSKAKKVTSKVILECLDLFSLPAACREAGLVEVKLFTPSKTS